MFDWSRKLFDLPPEVKALAPHPASGAHHRGYSAPGREKVKQYSESGSESDGVNATELASGQNVLDVVRDIKESFESGREDDDEMPNIWFPDGIFPGFKEACLDICWMRLFRHGEANTQSTRIGVRLTLRLLLSIPLSSRQPAKAAALSEMLMQDNIGGLEVEDPNHAGVFIPVPPVPGSIVVNVGDCLIRSKSAFVAIVIVQIVGVAAQASGGSTISTPGQSVTVDPISFAVLGPNGRFRNSSTEVFNPTSTEPPFFQIFDSGFLDIIGSNSTFNIVSTNTSVLSFAREAPVYVPETDELFFTGFDPTQNVVSKISLADIETALRGSNTTTVNVPATPLSLPPSVQIANGGTGPYRSSIVFATFGTQNSPASIVLVNPRPPYNATVLLDNFFGRQFNSIDDIKIHPTSGALFFTDTSFGNLVGLRPPPVLTNQVYRFDPATGAVRVVATDFQQPNGIAFSQDGKAVYVYIDIPLLHRSQVFLNRRVFAYADTGIPDGINLDAAGNVYSGCGDGVNVWSPDGVLLGATGNFRNSSFTQFFNPTASEPPFLQIFDPAFLNIIGPNPTFNVISSNDTVPLFAHEAPVYVQETDELFFVGFDPTQNMNKINMAAVERALQEAEGTNVTAVNVPATPINVPPSVHQINGGTGPIGSSLLFVTDGMGLLPPSVVLVNSRAPFNATVLLDNFFGRQFNSLDDVKIHPTSRAIFFTDVSFGSILQIRPPPLLPNQVYRFDMTTGVVRVVATDFQACNGIAFSHDGTVVYVYARIQAPSLALVPQTKQEPLQCVYKFDVDPKSQVFTNRRVFAYADTGLPDGIELDAAGNVYAGCGDGVNVWSSEGVLLGKFFTGVTVANMAFAGDGRLVLLGGANIYLAKIAAKASKLAFA
ncbi:hypothetical protein CVT25_013608 [Psilocybe cyanescens]|uniref:SMP-30/Gluconolactonase/LRE-like region domain-containing protein n=1 Tax=Psilocybe cyanescens TaxID=93625 RepID=A0A409WT36_PSICY|nr:hypothetical protein CVT25_013608 [Psilocybe cyanescens]